MKNLRLTMLVVAPVLLTSCIKLGPNYKTPEVELASEWSQTDDSWQVGREQAGTPDQWWTLFNDESLTALVQRARENNRDLKAAVARVQESRELLGIARAGMYPTLDANASVTRTRASEDVMGAPPRNPSNLWQAGTDATWEADFFGRVRRGVEAARADLASQEAALEGVTVTLQGEVALAYMDLRGAQAQLRAVNRNLAAQEETLRLTNKRLEAGLATSLDVARTQAQVATTRSQIPALHEATRRNIHRLSVLVGEEPGKLASELNSENTIPVITTQPQFNPPADLLRRRPDVRRAERLLAAETARIGVRKAELYPRFFISGNLGLRTAQLSDLSTGSSHYWSIGPGVTVPLFNAGALRAQVRAQDARSEAALETYRQTILLALEEAENALAGYSLEQERRAALEDAFAANTRALNLSRELFQTGVIDFLDVLDAERTMLASESALAESRARVARNLVTVWKAMGGSWEAENEASKKGTGG